MRQPFEVAARREDHLGAAGIARGQHFGGACPEQAHILRRVDRRRGGVLGRPGEIEACVEDPHMGVCGQPAGEPGQGVEIDRQAVPIEQQSERLAGMKALAQRDQRRGVGRRTEADRHARFLDRLADRRDPRRRILGIATEFGRQRAVARIDSPARKHQGTAGERHRLGALDHQDLRRHAATIAHQDQGRGGDRGLVFGHCGQLRP